MSDMPAISLLTSITWGASGCRRENASRRWVSAGARSAPRSAASANRRISTRSAAGALSEDVEIAGDDLKQVVEVVRHPAGKLADRFHFLRLPQRLFRLLALFDFGLEPDDRGPKLICAPFQLDIRLAQSRLSHGEHHDHQTRHRKDQGDKPISRRAPRYRIRKGLDVDDAERSGPLPYRGGRPMPCGSGTRLGCRQPSCGGSWLATREKPANSLPCAS